MYISFKIYILVYSACIFALSLILLRLNSEILRHTPINKSSVKVRGFKLITVIIVATVLPHMLRVSLYGIVPDPDVRVYENDSSTIMSSGYIQPDKLREDVYYRGFPIFTLLNVILGYSTSLSYYWTYIILHADSLFLFTLFILMVLKTIKGNSFNSFSALVTVLLLYSSSYFYALWDGTGPIQLGMIAILMLFFLFIKVYSNKKIQYLITQLLLYPFALVHVAIPIYLLVLFSTTLAIILGKSREPSGFILKSALLPILIFTFHALFSYLVLESFIDRINLFRVYLEIIQKSSYTLQTSELYHPIPAINAFGPAISIGTTLAFLSTVLFKLLTNRRLLDFNTMLLFGISATSLVLLFIGGVYQLSGVTGLGNVKMYPLMYGSFLAYLASIGIMSQLPLQALTETSFSLSFRLFTALYITLLIVGAVGGLTDPFTFHFS